MTSMTNVTAQYYYNLYIIDSVIQKHVMFVYQQHSMVGYQFKG